MCLAIAYRGNDLLYGFNLDIDPFVWQFSILQTKSVFGVGITVGKRTYLVHGVTRDGKFGNVPYMNGEPFSVPRGALRERIDLMNDRYLRGKYSFADIQEILRTKVVCNLPAATMHSLIGNGAGDFLIVEPGYGARSVRERFAVLSNFPVLTELPDDSNPFYGKDRYDKAISVLSSAGDDFSVEDALRLLSKTKQTGTWATRVSFVFSRNQNTVFFFRNGDLSQIETHSFS